MQSIQNRQSKRNHYSIIEHQVTTIWKIKCLYPKMAGQNDGQNESLAGQVRDQAGHCPLTGRYFQPCFKLNSILYKPRRTLQTVKLKEQNNKASVH